MTTNRQMNHEAIQIYAAIKSLLKQNATDYCQSWWIRFELDIKLSTSKVNQRCKNLVKQGYLTIDKSKTSTSCGISYKLTDKAL